jgi:hypothetical protein
MRILPHIDFRQQCYTQQQRNKGRTNGIPGKAQQVIGSQTQGVRNGLLPPNGRAHLGRVIGTQRDRNPGSTQARILHLNLAFSGAEEGQAVRFVRDEAGHAA